MYQRFHQINLFQFFTLLLVPLPVKLLTKPATIQCHSAQLAGPQNARLLVEEKPSVRADWAKPCSFIRWMDAIKLAAITADTFPQMFLKQSV